MRELYEETGLHVRNPKFQGDEPYPGFANRRRLVYLLVCDRWFQGELTDSPEGTLEWVEDEHLLALNLWEGDRVLIPGWTNPSSFPPNLFIRMGFTSATRYTFINR